MPGMRFTSWLSEDERKALREMAEDAQTSENFILRLALRALLFDAPLPEYLQKGKRKNSAPTHS